MYNVIEYAGQCRERIVYGADTFENCRRYVDNTYLRSEQDELSVDIVRANGSTEY